MLLDEQRRIAPLFCHRPVAGRLIDSISAQYLSRISDWGGSNLDANSLQSGSVLDSIQKITLTYSNLLDNLPRLIFKNLPDE